MHISGEVPSVIVRPCFFMDLYLSFERVKHFGCVLVLWPFCDPVYGSGLVHVVTLDNILLTIRTAEALPVFYFGGLSHLALLWFWRGLS